jgi:ABC-2 type transport system permease protein
MNRLLPVFTLWHREILRFVRQRSRLIGSLSQPLLFWVLLGSGIHASFRPPGLPAGRGYLEYFYPGTLAMVILFTAIFATISIVEDRRAGFLQGVLVAPVPRPLIVLGQMLGATTLAVLQGSLFLLLAPAAGIPLEPRMVAGALGAMTLLAFEMTGLGLIIAWHMESTQGFHAVMNLILIPLWLLSGAVFPAEGAAGWIGWVMRFNPVTYGMGLLRRSIYLGNPAAAGDLPPLGTSLVITALFCGAALALAAAAATRRGRS